MMLWQSARKEAQQIRAVASPGQHGLEHLVGIANMLGARVWVQELEPDVSGFVLKQQGAAPEIFINSMETPQRQRFTLAHEIGHLVERANLARDEEYSFIDHRSPGHYDLHEFFADEFAGELLMPAEQVQMVREEKGEYAAAMHFGVSVPAIRKRLERLNRNPGL